MNITLNYCEQGTGFPLILLHGNGENLGYFKHQIEYFSKFYRVIAIDTRGHGQSPRGTADFSISQFAEDLKKFMDVMGLERAHILGFSDGGNIGLIFALRYPDRVGKLILNGANIFPTGLKTGVHLSILWGYLIASAAGLVSPKARAKKELLGLMVYEPNLRPEELHRLKTEVLVIAGDKDLIKDKHTRLIAAHLPRGVLKIIPGDHFIAAKRAKEFNREVDRFLRSEQE